MGSGKFVAPREPGIPSATRPQNSGEGTTERAATDIPFFQSLIRLEYPVPSWSFGQPDYSAVLEPGSRPWDEKPKRGRLSIHPSSQGSAPLSGGTKCHHMQTTCRQPRRPELNSSRAPGPKGKIAAPRLGQRA